MPRYVLKTDADGQYYIRKKIWCEHIAHKCGKRGFVPDVELRKPGTFCMHKYTTYHRVYRHSAVCTHCGLVTLSTKANF